MSETPFEPKSLRIIALFTDSDARYQIPPYQRHYEWGDDEVNQLWEDLIESWEDNPKGNYFLGSVITSKPRTETRYVDVIDGQQRLTTLMILFCVIRDLYPNLNENNDSEFAVPYNTIKEAIKSSQDGRERFVLQQRFLPGDNSKTDFAENIIADGATDNLERPHRSLMDQDNPKHKFINSAFIFREKLRELGQEKAEEFINYLFYRVQVIRIDCKEVSFAIKLFQVINTRGLNLSPADLLKSFLFGEISDDQGEADALRRHFMTDWAQTEEMVSECRESMVNMFTLYSYYIRASNPKRSLYEELSDQFRTQLNNGEGATEILGKIKGFVKDYNQTIYDDEENKAICSLWYLPWEMHWKSILLSALQESHSNYNEIAQEIRRFYYLNWLAKNTLTSIKQPSFDVIKEIKEGGSIDDIRKTLWKNSEESLIPDAIRNLDSNKMAEQRWAKPLLILLEYQNVDSCPYIYMNSKLHLEHIFPQSPESGWGHINKDVAEKYLNSAGNITLLSGKKNIGARNKPFAEKIGFYKGQQGNSEGTTSFTITQKIISDYETNKYEKQWTEEAMRNRKEWFLSKIAKLLDIETELADYKTKP